MSEAPERTHDNLPRRLIIGGEPHGPIEIYNDDREFIGRGRIAQAPPPGGTAFIRADDADELKRQRDEAYRALVDIRDGGRTAEGQSDASLRAQAALDIISEMSAPSQDQAHGSPAIAEHGGRDA